MAKTLVIILLFFGSLFTGVFYLRPEWNTFKTLRSKTEYLEQISAELDELLKNRDALYATINSLSKEDLERLDQTIPRGQDAPRFMVFLTDTARKNQLSVKQIDLTGTSVTGSSASVLAAGGASASGGQPRPGGSSGPQAQKEIQELPFALTVTGPYESFKAFLRDLERNARIINVEDLSFSGKDAHSVQGVDYTLKMKTYYQ